jgi:regulator of replication initiation timing
MILEYEIIGVGVAAAVVVGVLLHAKIKSSRSKSESDDMFDSVPARYGLAKSKNGYRFSKYLSPKQYEQAVEEMVEAGWQYDEQTGEFSKATTGYNDKIIVSSINALVDSVEELTNGFSELSKRIETLEAAVKPKTSENKEQPLEQAKTEIPKMAVQEKKEPEKKPTENVAPEIDVLGSLDKAKTLAELSKQWNTNVNKTMTLLAPYLQSKKIIKIGKKYTLNPGEHS